MLVLLRFQVPPVSALLPCGPLPASHQLPVQPALNAPAPSPVCIPWPPPLLLQGAIYGAPAGKKDKKDKKKKAAADADSLFAALAGDGEAEEEEEDEEAPAKSKSSKKDKKKKDKKAAADVNSAFAGARRLAEAGTG